MSDFSLEMVTPPPDLLAGNMLFVDKINGNDATGTRGFRNKPFLTIQAAINAGSPASEEDVVIVFPGSYDESLTMKDNVTVKGVDIENCKIERSIAGSATIIIMADNMSFENFTLNITPSSGSITVISLAGTTNATSTARHLKIMGSSAITPFIDSGTGVASSEHFSIDNCQTEGIGFVNGILKTGTGNSRYRDSTFVGFNGATFASGILTIFGCGFTGLGGISNTGTELFIDTGTFFTTYTQSGGGSITGLKGINGNGIKQFDVLPGSFNNTQGNYAIRAAGSSAATEFSFRIPSDFFSFISAVVVGTTAANTVAQSVDLLTSYANNGQSETTNSESDVANTITTTANVFFEQDVTGVMTGVVARNNVGLKLDNQGIGTTYRIRHLTIRYRSLGI